MRTGLKGQGFWNLKSHFRVHYSIQPVWVKLVTEGYSLSPYQTLHPIWKGRSLRGREFTMEET